jgi:uncharacterized membrane protein
MARLTRNPVAFDVHHMHAGRVTRLPSRAGVFPVPNVLHLRISRYILFNIDRKTTNLQINPFLKRGRIMRAGQASSRFSIASAVFNLLDPIPFGFFVGTLIFDILYANTGTILWVKSAAWLVSIGLVFAIVPQLISLYRVWLDKRRVRARGEAANFWLNVVGIVAALVNAFVHSRDAYAAIPDAVWLSIVTVASLGLGRILLAGHYLTYKELNNGQA